MVNFKGRVYTKRPKSAYEEWKKKLRLRASRRKYEASNRERNKLYSLDFLGKKAQTTAVIASTTLDFWVKREEDENRVFSFSKKLRPAN